MFKKQQLYETAKPKIFVLPTTLDNQPHHTASKHPNYLKLVNTQSNPVKNGLSNNFYGQINVDKKRLKRAVFQFEGAQVDEEEQESERKTAVKMNVFRQSAREQQRQFHQQNHEYLRMFSVIATSAINEDKFKIKQLRDGSQSGQNKGQNKTSKSSQNYAAVHLQLQTQVTSSLITYKFAIRDVYNTVPFKRESIEFECRQFLDPKYQFFVFERCSDKVQEVRGNLRNVLQEGLSSEFKGAVLRIGGNLDYFQYLDLANYKVLNNRTNEIEYPDQLLQIAQLAEGFEITSDEQEYYTREQIKVRQANTSQRMVACEDFDLSETAPSVYFELPQEYTLYKKYREVEFKNLKIYNKDITINTDIRNIISSEKIYLIQLVKEIDLYIDLSTHNADMHIMKEIFKQLQRKCEEFLKVLCNYTESKILKHYNIENYHEKIMMFIQKSIKYNKPLENLDNQLLNEFPILKIWYEIPKVLFGYSRQKLHGKYYDLVAAMLHYQEKINDLELQKKLSIKRPGVIYPQ